MTLDESLTIKKRVQLQYNTSDDHGKNYDTDKR